jgi:hypothetical protein
MAPNTACTGRWVRAAFLVLSFFRFEGESTLLPPAANASHWAALCRTSNIGVQLSHVLPFRLYLYIYHTAKRD